MNTPASNFTDLYPMRRDIVGNTEQAFGAGTVFRTTLENAIRANTVSAIGTIAIETMQVQYIFNPKIYTKPDGTPISIIGNGSNKMGEFSLVHLLMSKIALFPSVVQKEVTSILPLGKDIPPELLTDTSWAGSIEKFACVSVPNIFFIYFGQPLPTGKITSDATKLAFQNLGPGYAAWANLVNDYITDDDDIQKVFDLGETAHANFGQFANEYFPQELVSPCLSILRAGPSLPITMVQSDDYPAIAVEIKKDYFPAATNLHHGALTQAATTLIVQHPSEIGKQKEAAKGHAKLLLLLLRADVNEATGVFTNVTQAEPSASMKLVLSSERSAQASTFADVLRKGFTEAKKTNPNDIRSRELSIKYIPKATAGHMLLGNFSLCSIATLSLEPNSIDITVFFPQTQHDAIAVGQLQDLAARMEEGLDVADAHRSKTVTAIKRVGKVASVKDVTSLLINMCTFVLVVTSSDDPKPLLYNMLSKIMSLTIDNDWEEWMHQCGGSIPNVHLLLLSYIDRIWVCFSNFCTDINNINVVSENRPLNELDTSEITKAIRTLNALVEEVGKAQAQGVPILTSSTIVSRFSSSGGVPTLPPATRTTPPSGPKNPNDKRVNPPPAVGGDPPPENPTKKPRRASLPKTELGIFYLTDPSISPNKVFPPNLNDKYCVNFTCKGRECLNDKCLFKHPRRAKDMDKADLGTIAKHFKTTKVGWFSAFHFANLDFCPEVESMLGNENGIASKPR